MKLLITGDWHLDTYRPRNRKDDYTETQFDKIRWIYETARDNGCYAILQPGDVFNSHKANDFLKRRYINMMRAMTRPRDDIVQPPHLYTIFGQHDLRFHSSNRENTPLSVLEAAEVCTICGEEPFLLDVIEDKYDVLVYGCNWGEEIPEIRNTKNAVHILLIHKLILEDTVGWEKGFISAENMFRFSKHDIIVCGDNHLSFMAEKFQNDYPNRLLFNCGSLMRNRIDQINHKPSVYIVDTCDLQYERHFVPVKPFEEVMDVEKATKQKERNEELEAFVSKLSGDVRIEGLDFLRNLESYMQENEIDDSIKEFIEEVLSWEP